MTFVHGDGLEWVDAYKNKPEAALFIDPPYTAGSGKRAGSRLYTHNVIPHERLFSLMETCQARFMMTYDNDADVQALITRHHLMSRPIAMQNTHLTKMRELVISNDLSWLA